MSEDLDRALRARKEFEAERDRRLEERFRAAEITVELQLTELRRQLTRMEAAQNRLIGLALGAPVVTAIIVYLLTRSGG